MQVSCSNCRKSYDLPDDRLPYGKEIRFSCPACKNKILLDLRQKAPIDSKDSDRVIFKPLTDTAAAELASNDLKTKIIKQIEDLPPMPKVLLKAREILNDPNSSFKDIAKVIETDQAIAARVLKVANSAYYGLSGMVSAIHQAAVVLGYSTLEQVITMVSSESMLGQRLKGYCLNAGALWRHSLAVALGSRLIAQKRAPTLESDAFAVGLIHDAGKLALDPYVLSKSKDIEAFLKETTASFLVAERHVLGFDHTEIAYDLCKKWKLPAHHAAAMRFHHNPAESDDNQLAHIIHLADHIANLAGCGSGPGFENESLTPASLKMLKFNDTNVAQMAAQVAGSVEEVTASLA